MNKDTINRTIAEAVGWKYHPFGGGWQKPGDVNPDRSNTPPRYTDCLNACAEMVRGISIHQQDQFSFELWSIIRRDRKASETEVGSVDFLAVNATASQRCEAFLKTLSLWTPTGEENE